MICFVVCVAVVGCVCAVCWPVLHPVFVLCCCVVWLFELVFVFVFLCDFVGGVVVCCCSVFRFDLFLCCLPLVLVWLLDVVLWF